VGLEQHAETFAANDVDFDLLPSLSDDDLKELGLSLGHRRRLLRAIAELSDTAEPRAPAYDAPPTDEAVREAERRQLTVLFCDLVGSTELSRQHDPEDLRELLRRYHDAVAAAVHRFGGYVANYLGDGVLAYFGWPRADEDEAAQAVRAGFASVTAARELSLQVHVGIASGTVVVGDLDGDGRRQTGAIAGETPNLAARLESLAGPEQILISGLTRQLIGAAFILDDLGLQQLKGIDEPIRVWQALAERSVESRFEARAGRLTRFVGREHEVALLVDRFERAAAGEGQAVLLSGEAGIGKSRIVQQLQERLSGKQHMRLRFQCSPSHTDIALYPVIRHLDHAAGFQAGDSPEVKLHKLEALLRRAVADNVTESIALLAPLLSLPGDTRYGAMELTLEQRSERISDVLVDQLLGLAAKEPILYVLEDAHWLDPTTQEVVTRSLGAIADARVMMLITHRPDFRSEWTRHPQVTALTLGRLSREQSTAIVRASGGTSLPDEVVARILQRAEGVPLFIEELTRSVAESDSTVGHGGIPETLQASLAARLDRLGADARETAQLGAVIGREFSSSLVAAVAGKELMAVDNAVQRLVASEIVLPQGRAGEITHAFRHALIQDAAYQSLLLSRRRQYHARVAQALEQHFPSLAETQPDLVARHYTAGSMPDLAIPYWLRAGERSRARFALEEAIAHLEHGVELARGVHSDRTQPSVLLDMLLALGETQRLKHGRQFDARETFREAAEIARSRGLSKKFAQAAFGVGYVEANLGDRSFHSVPLLEDALLAVGAEDSVDRARVLGRLGLMLTHQGDLQRAGVLFTETTRLARLFGDPRALWDVHVCRNAMVTGRACSAAEFPARRRDLDEGLAAADAIGEPDAVLEMELWRVAGFLEIGDHALFKASLSHYGALSEKYQLSNFIWGLRCANAMQAMLYGEFLEAERLANHAYESGSEAHGDIASGVYGVQMFTIRREQGRLAEVAPLVRRFVDENPGDAAWRPGLALIASDLGFAEAARKTFDDMAIAGFALPADAKRGLTLSYLAEVCVRLGDATRAEWIYQELSPYRDNTIIAPVATVCCGAAARYLGMLAGTMGDWSIAEEHFEAALMLDECIQAWPWLAHTQCEFAAVLQRRGRIDDVARANSLLGAAVKTAERLSMLTLQRQIGRLYTGSN